MGLFGSSSTVTTTFAAKDNMSPVVRGIRRTMDGFKRDVKSGFGLAAGFSVFGVAQQAIGTVVDFLGDASKAAMEDERSVRMLNQTLEENVDGFSGQSREIDLAIGKAQKLAFTDDQVRDSLNLLIPRTRDITEAIRLNGLAMDLARYKGMALEDAATLVGKAYNGQASALRRAGINIRDTKDGTAALADLQRIVAGQAESYAETTEGSFARASIAIDEAVEKIGYELIPILKDAAEWVAELFGTGASDDAGKEWAASFGGAAGQVEQEAFDLIETLDDTAEAVAGAIQPEWDEARDFARSLAEVGEAAGLSEEAIKDMFFTLKDDAGLGAEEAKRQIRGYIDTLLYAESSSKSYGTVLLATLGPRGTAVTGVKTGVRDIKDEVADLGDSLASSMRADRSMVQRAAADLAWVIKHPMYEAKTAGRAAMILMGDDMQRALRSKRPGVRQEAIRTRQAIARQFGGDRWYRIGARLATQIGRGVAANSLFRIDENGNLYFQNADGSGGVIVNEGGNGDQRAMGGPLRPGVPTLVGENGPEMVTLTGGGGYVTPNHHMNRPIVINVDGRKLFEITDARAGRAIAMGG